MTEPNLDDFRLPRNDNEVNEMIEKMMACGMTSESAEAKIKKRKKQYEVAAKKYVTVLRKQINRC